MQLLILLVQNIKTCISNLSLTPVYIKWSHNISEDSLVGANEIVAKQMGCKALINVMSIATKGAYT